MEHTTYNGTIQHYFVAKVVGFTCWGNFCHIQRYRHMEAQPRLGLTFVSKSPGQIFDLLI